MRILDIFRKKKRPSIVKFDDTLKILNDIIELLEENRTTIRKNKIDKIWRKK